MTTMSAAIPTGSEVIASLASPFTTSRRRGGNDWGISVRHPDVPHPFLVCHLHVDPENDRVTGFYFNCEKSLPSAELTAGPVLEKLRWCPDIKHTGPSPYMTAEFKEPISLSDLLNLINRSLLRHPRRKPRAHAA